MKDGPDVVLTMTRLALSDVQDHSSSRLPARRRRLHRERQPEASVEVDAAHNWLERTRQPVRPELGSAWIVFELVIQALIAGSLAGQSVDEPAHRRRRDYFVLGQR